MSVIITLVLYVYIVVVCCAIAGKAGYNQLLGLLAFIPVLNLILLGFFAFSRWPVEEELGALRVQADLRSTSK